MNIFCKNLTLGDGKKSENLKFGNKVVSFISYSEWFTRLIIYFKDSDHKKASYHLQFDAKSIPLFLPFFFWPEINWFCICYKKNFFSFL